MAGLATIEQLRLLHASEQFAVGEERVRRRTATNEALLTAYEDGIRTGELAQALGLGLARINARLDRARAHANSVPMGPGMVPLPDFAVLLGVSPAKVQRYRRGGLLPSARWLFGQWWIRATDAENLPPEAGTPPLATR